MTETTTTKRIIINTVGASAIQNFTFAGDELLIDIDDKQKLAAAEKIMDRGVSLCKELVRIMKKYYNDPEKKKLLPAEITSLESIKPKPDKILDRIVFLIGVRDDRTNLKPDRGTACGEALVEYYKDCGFEVEPLKVRDFVIDTDNEGQNNNFIKPMRLLDELENFIKKERDFDANTRIVINLTGGYKIGGIQAALVGWFYGCEMYYAYQEMNEVYRLPVFNSEIFSLEKEISDGKYNSLSPDERSWYQKSKNGYSLVTMTKIIQILSQMKPASENIDPTQARKVLFLSASPINELPTTAHEEHDIISSLLGRLPGYTITSKTSVHYYDLGTLLNTERPTLVHFSGHGEAGGELCFIDDRGKTRLVTGTVLAGWLESINSKNRVIETVILNACNTEATAQEVASKVKHVVGMRGKIDDMAAVAFARGFYQGVAGGDTISAAFLEGKQAIKTAGLLREIDKPILYVNGSEWKG